MIVKEYEYFNAEEILSLYTAVGWTAYTDDFDALKEGFSRSLLVLAAYEGERLRGILRAVGDGATVVFVQDLLVFPADQRKGVGTALLKELAMRFPNVRQIELVTDDTEKTKSFYRAAGFVPLQEIGCCGFMQFGPRK